MGPEGTGGQWHLPRLMASYIPAFKAMIHGMAIPIDFILWHVTVLAFSTVLHLSLILNEYWPPLWSITRKMWRQYKRAASLSGEVDVVYIVRVTIPSLRVHAVPLMTRILSMYML